MSIRDTPMAYGSTCIAKSKKQPQTRGSCGQMSDLITYPPRNGRFFVGIANLWMLVSRVDSPGVILKFKVYPIEYVPGLLFFVFTCNRLRPRQNGRHFPDDILKWIFLNENVWILNKVSLKFVTRTPINNIPALFQIVAWHRPGDKPLSEPVMVGYWCIYASPGLNEFFADSYRFICLYSSPWWRHQMETFSALLVLCAGNSPVTSEFPSQRPLTRSFDVFYDLGLNKRLSKQSRRR